MIHLIKCLLIILTIFFNINFVESKASFKNEKIIKLYHTINTKKSLSGKEKTDSILNSYRNDPIFQNSQWGFCVYNPITKKIIVSKDENQSYIPASTNKLITTETVLSILGKNFTWKTQIDYSGTIDSLGNLNGDIYLVSNNDPTLGYKKLGAVSKEKFFNTLVEKIKKKGIKTINGNLIAEPVIFKSDFFIPKNLLKIDHGNYFSIFKKNKKKLEFPVCFDTNSKLNISCYKKNIDIKIKNIDKNSSIQHSYFPLLLAKELKNYIVKTQKLKITGIVFLQNYSQSITQKKRKKIYTHESPELKNIVHFVNQTSNNHFAEQLLNSLGYFFCQNSTQKSSIRLVIDHLNNQKFDMIGLCYVDGSGLSRSNYITPIAQVKYLAKIMKKPFFDVFFESLPKAGETGTLKKMFINSNAIGKLRAKTGTLSNVKALTGYLDTDSGERLCFSLLVNNFSGTISLVKKRMEILLESVIEYTEPV